MDGYEFRDCKNKLTIPLYKYYSKYKYVKELIQNKHIHLEHPSTYNDIYDSTFVIRSQDLKCLRNLPKNLLKQIIQCLHSDDVDKIKYEDHQDLYDKCDNLQEVLDIIERFYSDVINFSYLMKEIEKQLRLNQPIHTLNNKISCFSETALSIPMWSYYGNSHKGVCIQFKFRHDDMLIEHLHKVIYTDFYNQNFNNFTFYYMKSRQWEHEQEWRIVCDTDKDYLPICAELSIILGAAMEETKSSNYFRLAKKYKLDLYKIKQSPNSFDLEMMKILDKGNPIKDEISI